MGGVLYCGVLTLPYLHNPFQSVEYSFGGHESHVSGIFNVPVKTELPGTRFRYVTYTHTRTHTHM
jgi:hypothetical protein